MEKVHAASEGKIGIKDSKHHFNIKLKDKDDFEDSRSGKIIFKLILVFKEVYREV